MVTLRELRIGNIVSCDNRIEIIQDLVPDLNNKMDRINSYRNYYDGKKGIPIKEVYPITLSGECFDKYLNDDFKLIGKNKYRYMGAYLMDIEFKPANRIDIIIDSKASTVKIKRAKAIYLHLLQNLYQAITGCEMQFVNANRLPLNA